MKHRRFLIAAVLTFFVLGAALIYQEKQQFDYFYLNEQYYTITYEPLKSTGYSVGHTVGTITQNAPVSAHQHDGDSNIFPVGTLVFTIDTTDIGYRDALAYFDDDNSELYIARPYIKRGDPLPANIQ